MEHPAESILVYAREIAGQCLGKSIADRVRMARALTLDDFYIIAVGKPRQDEMRHRYRFFVDGVLKARAVGPL